jgi:4-amino-4-deoxy-L-arabinose transferase-like glycosyltransferase
MAFCASRVIYAALTQLAPDEAVYWSWSRHLAAGYLDHPPMVAWLIRLSTCLIGQTALGVRLFSTLLGSGCLVIMLLLAARVLRERRAVIWVAALWLTSPLLAGFSTLATPDTSSSFFSLAALACAVLVFVPEARSSASRAAGLWMAFGALCGLAMVAKYTTVLLPASVGLALLGSNRGREQLRTPWPWISGAVALAVFSPVILWNHEHDWASFRFQLRHGLSPDHPNVIAFMARYLGGQLLIWTPVLFIIAIGVLIHYWRGYATLPAAERILLWAATVPLVFFGYAATKSHGEINWPAFAYFPLSILTVRWLAETWDSRRIGLVRNGCIVAMVGLFLMQVPRALGAVLPGKYRRAVMAKLDDMTGWPELGCRVAAANPDGRQIVCELHQVAGEVAFYTPGHPDAWPVGDGQRVYAFNYFAPRPDFRTIQRVLFVGANYKWFARRYGLTVTREEDVVIPLGTGGARSTRLLLMERPMPVISTSPSATSR